MAVEGSDCLTGKMQYATKDDARAASVAAKHGQGWRWESYKCPLCDWWHNTNRRGAGTKSRNSNARRARGRR